MSLDLEAAQLVADRMREAGLIGRANASDPASVEFLATMLDTGAGLIESCCDAMAAQARGLAAMADLTERIEQLEQSPARPSWIARLLGRNR